VYSRQSRDAEAEDVRTELAALLVPIPRR
jgi:hypothetical protein